jgi:Transglutaminase-like superfamily
MQTAALHRVAASPVTTAPPSPGCRFQLAAHVRACAVDDQFILLDLRGGRYTGVSRQHGARLGHVVAGWPAGGAADTEPAADIDRLIEPLLTKGLVMRATPGTPLPAPCMLDAATASLLTDASQVEQRVGARHLVHFALATTTTAVRLRRCSLEVIATGITRQRTGRPSRSSEGSDALRHAVAVFDRLRPLAFTARDHCLYHSLALIAFLALEGFDHPRWVIGVRTQPFRAHAWVQAGSLVLNDQHENVRDFCPILVV